MSLALNSHHLLAKLSLVMEEIRFERPREEFEHRIFPSRLEDEPNVLFHGTCESCARPIRDHGFQSQSELTSSSFSRHSAVPLDYACQKRGDGLRGVIFAVRFESLDMPGIRQEGDIVYLDDPSAEYEIIAYCYVPEDYQHI